MVMRIEYGGSSGGSDFSLDVDDRNLPSRREALAELGHPAAGIHRRAKHIPPNVVAQALNNEPFEDYSRAVYSWNRMCGEGGEAKEKSNQSYRQMIDNFLRRVFHSLTFIPGICFDIKKAAEKDERKSLDAALERYRAVNMQGQVDSLKEAYDGLRALRTVFGHVSPNNCFNMETVVPTRYVPELLVAAPVWFVERKVKPVQESDGSSSPIVRYFCDLGTTDRFAHLFQMYNRQPRYFDEFGGRDVMPLPIMELVGQVRDAFDFLVIATPYHDLAAEEWGDTRWVRNIDPFLFGFLKQVPELMFFLGRWSGTGLFPLIGDMKTHTPGRGRQPLHSP